MLLFSFQVPALDYRWTRFGKTILARTAHCDRPGYPSCSSLGSEDDNNAAGTSCPPGHSKAFCSAYNVAAGPSPTTTKPGSSTQKGNTSASSVGNNTTSAHQADAAHCDQPGYPSCYSMGFKDGE
jgi:hypothetical protein